MLVATLASGTVAGVGLIACAATALGGFLGVVVPLWPVLAAAALALPKRGPWRCPDTAKQP